MSLRLARPAILAILLAGIVVTLLLAPSTLEAQQGPPGERPGAGYGERRGPTAREITMSPLAGESADATWWVVAVIAVVVVGGGGAVLYLRRRA